MKWSLAAGAFAFAAAVQPGPLQAFLLSQVAAKGWRHTLPASFSPLVSDGPIAVLVLLVLTRLPDGFERWLQAAGGLLLLWFAAASFREWRAGRRTGSRQPALAERAPKVPRTLFQAAAINIVNPNPYLGWSLVLGPLFLQAMHHSGAAAIAVVASFYGTMVCMLAATIVAFGAVRSLGPGVARALILLSSLALALLGVWQLIRSVR